MRGLFTFLYREIALSGLAGAIVIPWLGWSGLISMKWALLALSMLAISLSIKIARLRAEMDQ